MVLLTIVTGLVMFSLGWYGYRWFMFRPGKTDIAPSMAYEVKLSRMAEGKTYSRSIWTGDDLTKAKLMFYTATGPSKTTVELYTRGNHTASRRV